jgi:hypothetical protein
MKSSKSYQNPNLFQSLYKQTMNEKQQKRRSLTYSSTFLEQKTLV